MGTRHPKSPCCHAHVQAFGGRRRRCAHCGRTWRVRRKQPGRKARRPALALVRRTVADKHPLVRQARPAGVSVPAVRQRFRQAVEWWRAHAPPPAIPSGALVLLVDGVWCRFAHAPWTLYLLALKPVGQATAQFVDPLLLPGRESARDWRVAMDQLPPEAAARIQALVSDGFRGSHTVARERGWIHQRCHFHLIAQLQGRRGHHTHLPSAPVREAIYQAVRQALVTPSTLELAQRRAQLAALAARTDCPYRLRMYTREFLRHMEAFRAYLAYPELQLPTTTNVVESMVKQLRDRIRPLSTPAALDRWAWATVRLHPVMVCNGHYIQPD